MPDNSTHTRTLSFTIYGPRIMEIARERLYQSDDFPGAVELLMHCLVTDQLTEGERLDIALKILDGRMEMVGTYPIDFDVVESNPRDEKYDLKAYFDRSRQRREEQKQQLQDLSEKLGFIYDNLDEYTLQKLDRLSRRELGRTILPTDMMTAFGVNPVMEKPLQEYLDRAAFENETTESTESDYGWLAPDGTFYPVPFGEHLEFAYRHVEKLLEQTDSETTRTHIASFKPSDYLHSLGWVLLHNPMMGWAKVVQDPNSGRKLTDRQCAFLFDYYNKRGLENEARKYAAPED